jgi:hypothetical protein
VVVERRFAEDDQAMAIVAASAVSTTAWFTLVGALGGVLLTSAVALTTAVLNHRWQTQAAERQLLQEHGRQLRQERRETYARYWSAWNGFTHQLRALRREGEKLYALPSLSEDQALDPKEQLAQEAPDVVEQSRIAELEWREAADVLLLIAGRAVEQAALAHIEATERRAEGVWRGEWPRQPEVYQRLNDAMRNELLAPTEP